MRRLFPIALLLLASSFCHGGEDEAELRMHVKNGESMHYNFTITSNSVSTGREQGKPITITANGVLTMTLQLKGMPAKGDSTPVAIRLQNINDTRNESAGDDKRDWIVSRDKVKFTVNGKVVVDSENDIGQEYVSQFLDNIKIMESGEAHSIIDGSGRQTLMEGDPALIDRFRDSGVHSIFPVLAGKSVPVGTSWEDTLELPKMGQFKLAKAAVFHSKMTFAKWETKNGRRLAQIEMVQALEHNDLKGENPNGTLAEISHINDVITGTCLFDPATGRFTEGTIKNEVKYHIDGEFEAPDPQTGKVETQRRGLDVTGKSTVAFELREK